MAETPVGIEAEASVLAAEEEMNEALEAAFGEWRSSKGDPLTWMVQARARVDVTLKEQVAESSELRLRKFGETIVSVPPVLAAPAYVESKWTMVDSAGYTIPAGTQVSVAAAGDVAVGFLTVGDVTIAPGATTATILLQAAEPGVASNGVSGEVGLLDSLAFVASVELLGVSSGGVDEEDEPTYLSRLVQNLQLLSLALVVGRDFETDARSVPGIARVKCIEAYNAEAGKEEGGTVSVYPIDAAGAPMSAPVKTALKERQTAKVPSGVLVFVADPAYTYVDFWATVVVKPGYDPATTLAAAKARGAEYFDPAKWGIPTVGDSGGGWENRLKVYRFELISEMDRVGGVERVASLLLGGGAGKAFTVEASTDKFASTAHGFSNGDAIVFRAGSLTPGAPLAVETIYYVRDVETNAFKVTTTVGGAALNVTTNGSGTAIKLSTVEELALTGVAPLTKPGAILVSAA